MSDTKLTGHELHRRIIQGLKSMTREDWQERIDAAHDAFDRQEAAELAYNRETARPKRSTAIKRSHKAPESVAR